MVETEECIKCVGGRLNRNGQCRCFEGGILSWVHNKIVENYFSKLKVVF